MFANGLGNQGSIACQVMPKTQKKGRMEQSKERSSALCVVANEKGAFGLSLTFHFLFYSLTITFFASLFLYITLCSFSLFQFLFKLIFLLSFPYYFFVYFDIASCYHNNIIFHYSVLSQIATYIHIYYTLAEELSVSWDKNKAFKQKFFSF